MSTLPAAVHSAAEVRAMDRHAIDVQGIPGYTLMQRAGEAAFDLLLAAWPAARRVLVACGAGNNGGDGYVVARLAREAGLEVAVAALADPSRLTGDAARAHADFAAAGGTTQPFTDAARRRRRRDRGCAPRHRPRP
jgi:ADP-dependent NAD(P)H-hydrate dehydratase / NAD(P)H-hydrate epimerase